MDATHKSFLKKTMWVAIIVFAIRCFISWTSLTSNPNLYNVFGYAGESIGIAVVVMAIYERWLWRFNPLEDTPALRKKYAGIIISSYDGIRRDATLTIKQTLLSIHVTLISGESKSKSVSASISEILGEKQLIYSYLNTPKSECRDRSEIHFGTATLCVDNPEKLIGQYYTDRKTVGDMDFSVAL